MPLNSREVKKVERWQTTDGQLFVGMIEACDHQQKLDRAEAVTRLIEDEGWEGMTKDEVVTMILEQRTKLREIL